MRQNRGSIVCPSCGKLIGISEPECPFCGAWRPGLFGWAPALQRLFRGRLNLVSLIMATCIVMYVVSLLLDPEAISAPRGVMSLLAPGQRALYQVGMTGGLPWRVALDGSLDLPLGRVWGVLTLLTAIYLHGGLLHIFFNLMWVRDLGPVVEEMFGPARAFIIFQVSGAFGFLVSNLITGVPTLGASGSIFGLLAALIVYGRRRGGGVMSAQLWQWAIVLFVMGLLLPAVNNWAHAGGFAGGWLTSYLMGVDDRREGAKVMLGALALIVLTAMGFVLSFVNVTTILLTAR